MADEAASAAPAATQHEQRHGGDAATLTLAHLRLFPRVARALGGAPTRRATVALSADAGQSEGAALEALQHGERAN
tara:strand:- start:591 stop:818 length:228 start_codon:yes stop_codon:yes gene_type:complete